MLRVLALSAVALTSVEGSGFHFNLKLKVTDKSKFGEDQTDSNGAITTAIVNTVDGLEKSMVSLWVEPTTPAPTTAGATPSPTAGATPSPSTAGEKPAPSPAENSTDATPAPSETPAPSPAENSTDATPAATTKAGTPAPTTPAATTKAGTTAPTTAGETTKAGTPAPTTAGTTPAPTTPAPTTPAPTTPAPTTAAATTPARRLADGGEVTIPVYLHGLPTTLKADAVETAVKSESMMTKLNAALKTAGVSTTDMVTEVSVTMTKKTNSDASAAWKVGAPLLSSLGAVLALLSL